MVKRKTAATDNPMAKVLSDPRYQKRVVASKKVYNRKKAGSKRARPSDFKAIAS